MEAEQKNVDSEAIKCSELLCCPLCGQKDFDMSGSTDDRIASIYCKYCPYGVEDSTMTLAELKAWHNPRAV